MNFCGRRFNLYLLLAATMALAAGCLTNRTDRQLAILRVHLESRPDALNHGKTVPVLRSEPVLVPIATDPILTEANIVAASVVETPGGFAVEIKYDETGSWILEQYSSANSGKHFAVFGQWNEKTSDGRWLAAPLITGRIANGMLSFTPDASRDEADQLVRGLNNVAKKAAQK
jgi:preprotein translocase subunit SecD